MAKKILEEIKEIYTYVNALTPEQYKIPLFSYIRAVENLFVKHLTDSLWDHVITKTQPFKTQKTMPSMLSIIKSAFNEGNEKSSIETLNDSFKAKLYLPISTVVVNLLNSIYVFVTKIKIDYHKKPDENKKLVLQEIIRKNITKIPEYKLIRERLDAMVGGKKRSLRIKYKRKKTIKNQKGGTFEPSSIVSEWIKRLCDYEVQRFNFSKN